MQPDLHGPSRITACQADAYAGIPAVGGFHLTQGKQETARALRVD